MSRSETKILVIDDEGIIRDSCRRALSARGYNVHTAADGREGLKMISENLYDVVFLDLVMPDTNTQEVADGIRSLAADTRLVIISGYGSDEAKLKATQMGAAMYLEKPFSPSDLVDAINRAHRPGSLH